MKTDPEGAVRQGDSLTDEQDRGDRSTFASVFRRLVTLAAEILPGLSSRQDIEMRLGVSGTRISKDVRNLADLGIAVSRAGHKYVVTANRFPVLVGAEETQALILAHQVLLKAGMPEEVQLRGVIDRIPQAIRSASGEWSSDHGGIEFPPAFLESHAFAKTIDDLRKIIRSGRMFRISYQSRRALQEGEASSPRMIDRAELVYLGTVYLSAWEDLGGGTYQPRTFRLDRIADIEPLASPVSKSSPPEFEYVYRLSDTMAPMAARPPGAVATPLEDGRLEVRASAKTDLLARMHVLRYGPDAEVVAPESLRQAVAEALGKGARLYGPLARHDDTAESEIRSSGGDLAAD